MSRKGTKTIHKQKILRIVSLIALAAQIVSGVLFEIFFNRSNMFPWNYVVISLVILAGALVISIFLYLKGRILRIIGLIISIIMIIISCVGSNYLVRAVGFFSLGNDTYKTDNMVVVVRSGDSAEKLSEAKDYTFAVLQNDDNTNTMVKQIRSELGSDIATSEYSSVIDEANALINGDVDAAIYNSAYNSVIEDVIDGYEDKIKTIYQYGIEVDIKDETVDPGDPFNVYFSGIDVYGDITQTSRSDVNIIMTVNPQSKHIMLTSTPRDYYVTIPDVSGEKRDKLTHAGIYGVDASMATLENLYGSDVDITYYVRVNFTTLQKLVDALGGIDIYVDYSFDAYTDDIHFDKGWTHMDGRHALAFVRERYSFSDGDNQRGRDQEAVLKAILEKVMSTSVLTNASSLLDSLSDTFQTNIPESKMEELIRMQLSDNASWNIQKQVAGEGVNDMLSTYSGGSTPLSVTWPNNDGVRKCAARIAMVMNETDADKMSGNVNTDNGAD